MALLAVSGMLFLVPLAAPTIASGTASPTISLAPNVFFGTATTGLTVSIANPSSNSYAITGFTIFPTSSSWVMSGSSPSASTFTCSVLTGGSLQCVNGDLAPGGSVAVTGVSLQAPAVSSYPAKAALGSTVQFASSSAFSTGPSTAVYEIETGTTVSFTPSSVTNFVAGSAPLSLSVALSNADDAGIPVSLASTSGTFSASSGTTGSGGSFTVSFTPSNTAGTATLTATIGTSATTGTGSVTTIAAAPSQVTITLPGSTFATTAPTDYITSSGTDSAGVTLASVSTGISISLADRFGNPVAFAAGDSLNIITSNGQFNPNSGSTMTTSITESPTSGSSSYSVTNGYFQSELYGTISTISAALTRGSSTYSGQSGQLITSTLDTTTPSPTPSIEGSTSVAAGSTVYLHVTLSPAQKGVPVEVYLDAAASTLKNANGHFSNGATSIVVNTGTNGTAVASFVMDTGAGATLMFGDNVTAPINGNAANTLGASAEYAISTVAGAPAKMIVTTYFDSALTESTTHAVNTAGTTLYVDIALADKYGNPTTDTLGYQIQIALSGPGSFSATNVYISQGATDTKGSFGPILWTTPTALGSAVLTASSSLGTATHTVTIVTPTPLLYINTVNTSPLVSGKTFYVTSDFVSINGNASASMGYPPTTTITSVCYTLGTGSNGCASITPANSVTFSIPVSLTSGLNTVSFNATDSSANTVKSTSYTILVDSAKPDVNFVTANNANISSPATVSAHVVDSEGDLNASSVTAVATNLQTSATKTLTASVTGTNNLGHSVTYAVTVSGLTTGNWSVALTATDLAGNSNSSTITVHVTVPFAQSFVVSGTPHSATIGSFTGINASYTNLNPTSQSVVVFAVFKNSAGQTMGIGTGSLTVGAGATQSVFIAEPVGLASGTYSVSIFVFTTGNLPVSVSTSISVTV